MEGFTTDDSADGPRGTVAIEPTFESVGVLAAIVVVRTFLSWALEVELSGRWPWQRERGSV